jgi:hypothetical protein
MRTVKRKRQFGRKDNVSKNLFFESFMSSVSKGTYSSKVDILSLTKPTNLQTKIGLLR